jgi:hypothetical protein
MKSRRNLWQNWYHFLLPQTGFHFPPSSSEKGSHLFKKSHTTTSFICIFFFWRDIFENQIYFACFDDNNFLLFSFLSKYTQEYKIEMVEFSFILLKKKAGLVGGRAVVRGLKPCKCVTPPYCWCWPLILFFVILLGIENCPPGERLSKYYYVHTLSMPRVLHNSHLSVYCISSTLARFHQCILHGNAQ